jgi:hypothetical protein
LHRYANAVSGDHAQIRQEKPMIRSPLYELHFPGGGRQDGIPSLVFGLVSVFVFFPNLSLQISQPQFQNKAT